MLGEEQGLLAQAWGGLLAGSQGAESSQRNGREPCPQPCPLSAWSAGLFPEEDIPEEAHRKLREGKKGRRAKKRSPKSQLQNKTGRTSACRRGGAYTLVMRTHLSLSPGVASRCAPSCLPWLPSIVSALDRCPAAADCPVQPGLSWSGFRATCHLPRSPCLQFRSVPLLPDPFHLGSVCI